MYIGQSFNTKRCICKEVNIYKTIFKSKRFSQVYLIVFARWNSFHKLMVILILQPCILFKHRLVFSNIWCLDTIAFNLLHLIISCIVILSCNVYLIRITSSLPLQAHVVIQYTAAWIIIAITICIALSSNNSNFTDYKVL